MERPTGTFQFRLGVVGRCTTVVVRLPEDGIGTAADAGADQLGRLAFDGHRLDGVDLRRRRRHQDGDVEELAVQFDARAALLQPALELAVVAVVRGARDHQIVLALGRLVRDPVVSQSNNPSIHQSTASFAA